MIATRADVIKLREGGRRLAKVLKVVLQLIVPGISTEALEDAARRHIKEVGGVPAFLGYTPRGASRPYPAALCASVNEEVVHGIPNENPRILREGDIVTLDAGLLYGGLITDMAITAPVGKVSQDSAKLISAAREALATAIATARPGATTEDVGAMVEATAKRHGFAVARELGGHGVGRSVHEEPFVPNFGKPGTGAALEEGMVLAIEPILIDGSGEIELADDGYTYVTKDGSRAAQFEHTVLITDDGCDILTKI